MAHFSEQQLPRYREDDLPGTLKKLYNFCRELQEMLQFVLCNLDADNIEGYEEIFNRLSDADGNLSILKQTAEEILLQVRQNDEKIGELRVRADGITARVQDTEKGVAELRITADGILQRVGDNEGNISSLQQTAKGLASRVFSAEGDISSLEQTAGSLTSRISNAEGAISTVRQTASGLQSTVSDLSGKYTEIRQDVDRIDVTGLVSFQDLERAGRTEINGNNITTGSIELEFLNLTNGYGGIEIGRGSTGIYGTRGAMVYGPDSAYYMIVTGSGCRMTAVQTHFYVAIDEVHSSVAIDEGSDARIKNTILYDVADRYADFYKALRPARFHRNDGKSGRFHTGFIAQQLRDALFAAGLTAQDLAALVQQGYTPDGENDGAYSIRYTELVALNTAMVQRLTARVEALEDEVSQLRGGV